MPKRPESAKRCRREKLHDRAIASALATLFLCVTHELRHMNAANLLTEERPPKFLEPGNRDPIRVTEFVTPHQSTTLRGR